jgi:ribosomal protein L23
VQETTGIPIEQQILTCGSTMIHGTSSYSNEDSHHDEAKEKEEDALLLVPEHDMLTMTVSQRVRGGKQVPVKMMTNHLPCGSQVTIDIDENATKDEIKLKLQEATGVPFEHIKVMLSGINQIVMGDKRTNVGYSTCGYANSVQLAVEKADS